MPTNRKPTYDYEALLDRTRKSGFEDLPTTVARKYETVSKGESVMDSMRRLSGIVTEAARPDKEALKAAKEAVDELEKFVERMAKAFRAKKSLSAFSLDSPEVKKAEDAISKARAASTIHTTSELSAMSLDARNLVGLIDTMLSGGGTEMEYHAIKRYAGVTPEDDFNELLQKLDKDYKGAWGKVPSIYWVDLRSDFESMPVTAQRKALASVDPAVAAKLTRGF